MSEQFIPIPADTLPEFDELYSISDLHLGGLPGFQIFNLGAELQRLIEHLRTSPPKQRIALVINGDFVDFLAEEPTRHFDPFNAVAKLNRLVGDPAFAMVWSALQEFAKTANRSLLINLGNHDLELALPWVRQRLLEILSGGDLAARGRITFSFDGAGVLCRVGNALVLCVHGNEVDDWNLADYETLRRQGRNIVQGQPVADWQPNAGAKMVIEVMNDLKKDFPFIDLLKPEVEGLLPTLAALVPDKREKLREIAGVAARLKWDSLRRRTGFLAGEEEAEPTAAPAPKQPVSRRQARGSLNSYAQDLLAETEVRLERHVEPLDLVGREQRGEMLSFTSAVLKWVRGADPSEILREALEELRQDRSFEFTDEDTTYKALDEQVGGNVDFLLAGHTHLERALPRKKGRGYYFNSGTWARLIQFEKAVLEDPARFRAVFDVFKAGSMKKLDAFPNLVLRRPTVVAVWTENGQTHGELRRVNLARTKEVMKAVAGTRFTKA